MARRWMVMVLAVVLGGTLLAGCGSGDDDDGGSADPTTTVAAAGDDGDGGGDAGGTEQSPAEIASAASVPVPEGYTLTNAKVDGDTTMADLTYEGGPDVPGYQAQMEAAGWAIDSVTPINSFCIRAKIDMRYAEVTYLETNVVLWTISDAYGDSMCARRQAF